MTTIRNLTAFFMLSQNVLLSTAQTTNNLTPNKREMIDTIPSTFLTITKVKKPWYAWRRLIISKMKVSIPEYKKISGLNLKLFSITENNEYFGGIYQWQNLQDAQYWFNKTWFERTEKKYGSKGIVDFYSIIEVRDYGAFPSLNLNYWSVLSSSEVEIDFTDAINGIIKYFKLKDELGNLFYLTIWDDKTKANQFFDKKTVINVCFDSPLVIIN